MAATPCWTSVRVSQGGCDPSVSNMATLQAKTQESKAQNPERLPLLACSRCVCGLGASSVSREGPLESTCPLSAQVRTGSWGQQAVVITAVSHQDLGNGKSTPGH